MSCKKYRHLSPKNLPDYEGVVPTITFNEENYHWFSVYIYKYIMSDAEAICSEEAESLRLAKKKAFKKYMEICNGKNNSNI